MAPWRPLARGLPINATATDTNRRSFYWQRAVKTAEGSEPSKELFFFCRSRQSKTVSRRIHRARALSRSVVRRKGRPMLNRLTWLSPHCQQLFITNNFPRTSGELWKAWSQRIRNRFSQPKLPDGKQNTDCQELFEIFQL